MMDQLAWYWRRLGRMSAGEMGYRGVKTVKAFAERAGIGTAQHPPLPTRAFPTFQLLPPLALPDKALYLAAADRTLRGEFDVFAIRPAHLGFPPAWNTDPASGVTAPLSFGKQLDYRNPQQVGDIKYLWEPNRHLQLVTLAQAYALSDDVRYLHGIRTLLDSWFDQCPYLRGANWASSLELAIRLISWSLAWHTIGGVKSELFAGDAGNAFKARWLANVYQHCHFIAGAFSRYSSANNHLIGEAAGLYVGATTWRIWNETDAWRDAAKSVLIAEAAAQNTGDGVNKEQAIAYQQFVLDFLLIAALHGRRDGDEFPAPYWHCIESMIEFIAALMDVSGNLPMIGDADDGFAVQLSQEPGFCPFRSLLATGAVLFNRGDFARKAGKLDDKTRTLLGDNVQLNFTKLLASTDSPPQKQAFPEGGYYVLGSHFNEPQEIRIIVDAGPLGYTTLAAHGHADALALWISAQGREILIDPGTYAYHTKKSWRNYFRGSLAHNTLCVDELDQSEIGGNFMWLRHANAFCEKWISDTTRDEFVGWHDGYLGLEHPVKHIRHLKFEKATRRLTVVDRVETTGPHQIAVMWHFAEDCEVTPLDDERTVEIRTGDVLVRMNIRTDFDSIRVLRGSEEPIAGWVSRRFDCKVATTTIRCEIKLSSMKEFHTEFAFFDRATNE